ncbi:M3 family oligoendopeptidase [Falsibacillus albus]|uniref:M3 family oligoendopeptidase n=1 Tax=Falsibacillus albus TaxID=2478915 RepID=A0A3L7JUY4_9BACI|nr:M3 family oligoendopeptidase [Falsibacillus albus]RLQ94330.1 M3 family oligoendopeptidase [Falsibacillus albus]
MEKVYIEKFDLSSETKVKGYFDELLKREIDSATSLESWLIDVSDLYDGLGEAMDGHYIDFQAYNQDEAAKKAFEYDQEKLAPLVKKYESKIDEKFLASPFKDDLDQEEYGRFIHSKSMAQKLFNEKNVELEIEEDKLATQYFELTGSLTVDWNGNEMTLTQLTPFLEDPNREIRKKAYSLISESMLEIKDPLQEIMSKLLVIRKEKAENSGLKNYRDYMFKKYERFDYTPEDCKELAESIRKHALPLLKEIQEKQKTALGVDKLRPYDIKAVPADQRPLRPFKDIPELIEKTSTVLGEIDPRFSELIILMNKKGMLDLENRKNKSPGGFCTPLPVSELSYIFMNASRTHSDMLTLFHEMGHCIHNDFKRSIDLSYYRDTPMESSELASMTMELLTMDKWHLFYPDQEDLKQAKLDQLKHTVKFLPEGVKIDLFQHWMYENPDHSKEERMQKYLEISQMLDAGVIDWDGYDYVRESRWLFVLHIFEVPFYYIEYVIAQLGALQMYKQYKDNPEATLSNYKEALALGNTKSLKEVYEVAGIRFDFSAEMVKELMAFVKDEIMEIEKEG